MYIFATDACRKHNGYDIPHALLLCGVSASPHAVIISTVAALTVTHSHTPSEQVIVPVFVSRQRVLLYTVRFFT